MLTKNQLNQVCLYGCGHSGQCRYIDDDEGNEGKFYCKKMRPVDKEKIDKKAEQFIADSLAKGTDPYKEDVPLGDNCPGFLVLRNISQGIPD